MRRPLAGVGVLVAAVALLAGCDSGGSGPTGPTTTPPTSAAPTSPTATVGPPTDGEQLVDDARTALYGTSSFHVSGTIAEFGVVVDLQVGTGRVTSGTVSSVDGGTLEVRQLADGTRYGRGDADFYADYAVGPDLTGLAGKWVVIDDDAPAPLGVYGDYAEQDTLVFAIGVVPEVGDYEISAPQDVDGTRAYVVTGRQDTWAIAADGPPLPVEATNDDSKGTVRFDRYDEPFTVEAPAAGDIVEIPTS